MKKNQYTILFFALINVSLKTNCSQTPTPSYSSSDAQKTTLKKPPALERSPFGLSYQTPQCRSMSTKQCERIVALKQTLRKRIDLLAIKIKAGSFATDKALEQHNEITRIHGRLKKINPIIAGSFTFIIEQLTRNIQKEIVTPPKK